MGLVTIGRLMRCMGLIRQVSRAYVRGVALVVAIASLVAMRRLVGCMRCMGCGMAVA